VKTGCCWEGGGYTTLHNEELNNLYCSPTCIRTIYISAGNPAGIKILGDLHVDGIPQERVECCRMNQFR
jgi:hypothetical protein